jgi:hypothetical protein
MLNLPGQRVPTPEHSHHPLRLPDGGPDYHRLPSLHRHLLGPGVCWNKLCLHDRSVCNVYIRPSDQRSMSHCDNQHPPGGLRPTTATGRIILCRAGVPRAADYDMAVLVCGPDGPYCYVDGLRVSERLCYFDPGGIPAVSDLDG